MSSSSCSDWLTMDNTTTTNLLLMASPCVAEASNHKVYVEHNYVDHYNEPIYSPHDGSSKRRGPRGGVLVPFPEKLYQMLNQIAEDGLDDVVSWQPHGRCFVVHQPERFVKEVMPRYFSQTKLTSFQRQVNLYGFRRLTTGTDRNGYYHELFLRGRPDLLKKMTRVRVKGIGCKLAPSPATEPNLYRLPTCLQSKMADMLLTEESCTDTMMPPAKTSSCSGLVSNNSSGGYLESYMAGKLGQARHLMPVNGPQSLLFQVSGRNRSNSNTALARPCSPKSMSEGLFPTFTPSFHPTASTDDDLTPLPSGSISPSYLVDMQDDIINLLSSCETLCPSDGTSSNAAVMPPRTPSSGNILTDMANFWEI